MRTRVLPASAGSVDERPGSDAELILPTCRVTNCATIAEAREFLDVLERRGVDDAEISLGGDGRVCVSWTE